MGAATAKESSPGSRAARGALAGTFFENLLGGFGLGSLNRGSRGNRSGHWSHGDWLRGFRGRRDDCLLAAHAADADEDEQSD